ncbi:MAG TPA: NAD(P)-binding domain-containing protein [Stellaceae bacterium]|nr:NAD(P)-binding domain-containing protein [Stellaceae bacterium]
MRALTEVVVIGAGPYGLSIAAHLRQRGIAHRIFGIPMLNWRIRMPQGMLLKSDGFASNLSDPEEVLTLGEFCRQRGIRYADDGVPVAIEDFIAYGEAFQRRFVPEVEARSVVGLSHAGDRFAVQLDDGEIVSAGKIVVAVGVSDFAWLPAPLSNLPEEFLTHSSQHAAMDVFRGREVAVVGSGSSAIDIAALLHEKGASVRLIARRSKLAFHAPPEPGGRTLHDRLRAPSTGIGPGWRSLFYTQAPLLFRLLPESKRLHIVATASGPAGGWFMMDRVVGRFPVMEGYAPQSAEIRDGRIYLRLAGSDGSGSDVSADHVIAATGYKVDLRRLKFLDDRLRAAIRSVANSPILSSGFEASVPGLYFVGPAASNTFGPLLRFVYGAEFTTPRVIRHLTMGTARRPTQARPALAAR